MVHIHLGGRCQVELDGRPAGAPPSESVMVLLCGLASRSEQWSSRDEVARKLYPSSESDRRANALRQCIYRLRRWLNDSILESEGDLIRLRPGMWRLDLDIPGEETPNAATIAPGLEHGWIDEIRMKYCPAPVERPVDLMKGFTDSVLQLATFDPNAARGLFVSAANLSDHFSLQNLMAVLSAVRPQSKNDPHAADFHAMCAWMAFRTGMLEEAIRQANQALQSKPSRRAAVSMVSLLFYAGIEQCDDVGVIEARAMADKLSQFDGLDTMNMCLYWNVGAIDEAVLARDRALTKVDGLPQRDQLTFWLNSAYFNADIGDMERCEESLAAATAITRAQDDNLSLSLLNNALAKLHLLRREAEAAQRAILEAKAASQRFGRVSQDIYVLETQSEVSAALGHHERARTEWSTFLHRRKGMGMGITNRLMRQQTRILV